MKNGVKFVYNLNNDEIAEIKDLIEFYNKLKGISFKFDPGFLTNSDEEANHVLFYDNDKLIGYMSVDCYNGDDVEAAPIVNKMEVFQAMHHCLIEHVKEKGKKKLLYIVDRTYHFLENCLRNLNIKIDFSESRMELNPQKFKHFKLDVLKISDATEKDKKDIFKLDRDTFGYSSDLEEVHLIEQMDISHTKMAFHQNETIGKVKIFESNRTAGIYGFVIYPHFRGKGFGKVFLTQVISEILKNGVHTIYLEVETKNVIAIHLYHAIGFDIQATFDYYLLHLK